MYVRLPLLWLLAACVSPPDDGQEQAVVPETPAVEETPELRPIPRALLREAIDAWTEQVLGADFTAPEAIADLMQEHIAPRCPIWAPAERGELWTGTPCTTVEGTRFYGAYIDIQRELDVGLLEYLDQDWIRDAIHVDEPDWVGEGVVIGEGSRVFSSNSRVTLSNGRELSLSGGYHNVHGAWPGVSLSMVTLSGPWWNAVLEQRPEPGVTVLRFETGQGEVTLIDGFVRRPNDDVEVVAGDHIRQPDHLCSLEPTGEFHVRDLDHLWYDITFGGDCDGCGEVRVDDILLGELCLEAP